MQIKRKRMLTMVNKMTSLRKKARKKTAKTIERQTNQLRTVKKLTKRKSSQLKNRTTVKTKKKTQKIKKNKITKQRMAHHNLNRLTQATSPRNSQRVRRKHKHWKS